MKAATPRGGPSLRLIAAVCVVTPVVLVSMLLVVLNRATSERVAEDLTRSLIGEAVARVEGETRWFLSHPERLARTYRARILGGRLPADPRLPPEGGPWLDAMLEDLRASPTVASICFGTAEGHSCWLLRGRGGLELGTSDGDRGGSAIEFRVNSDGDIDPAPIRRYTYDPRQRPWFSVGASAKGDALAWTPIYFWFGDGGAESETGAGVTTMVGEDLGVVVVDVTLGSLSDMLRGLPLADRAALFLVDAQGKLVAASRGHVNSNAGGRLALADSETAEGRAAASVMSSLIAFAGSQGAARTRVEGENVLIVRQALSTQLPWSLITVIPEKSYLSEARAAQRRGVWIGLIASLGAALVAWRLSARLTGPLMKIREHVRRVGGGDLESRLSLRSARELAEVSDELNAMTQGLKEHLTLRQSLELAMKVQQSLLPQRMPSVPGLDVAGRSTYCDETGGDYFDFLEVAPGEGGRLLIAVGDVMGHGIPAALLMATARAALRAGASHETNLGTLMRQVNAVLSRDAGHGRFMTMALVAIDPARGTVRWASAGHDPTIVFEPGSGTDGGPGRFLELEGGDIPLGMSEDVEYEEYSRTGLTIGSVLVIGTDGIWEASPGGTPGTDARLLFGKDRLRTIIAGSAAKPAAGIATEIERSLREFRGEGSYEDDVTYVVIRIT